MSDAPTTIEVVIRGIMPGYEMRGVFLNLEMPDGKEITIWDVQATCKEMRAMIGKTITMTGPVDNEGINNRAKLAAEGRYDELAEGVLNYGQ